MKFNRNISDRIPPASRLLSKIKHKLRELISSPGQFFPCVSKDTEFFCYFKNLISNRLPPSGTSWQLDIKASIIHSIFSDENRSHYMPSWPKWNGS